MEIGLRKLRIRRGGIATYFELQNILAFGIGIEVADVAQKGRTLLRI